MSHMETHLIDIVHANWNTLLHNNTCVTQSMLPASMNSQDERISPKRPCKCQMSLQGGKWMRLRRNWFWNTLHSLKVSSTLGKSGRDKNAKLTDLVWKVSMFVSWPFFLNGGIYSPWSSWARYGDPGDKAQSTLGTDEKMLQVVTSVVLLHAGRREK